MNVQRSRDRLGAMMTGAGIVLGLIAAATALVAPVSALAFPIGLVAATLGIVAYVRARTGTTSKPAATRALVVGASSAVLALALQVDAFLKPMGGADRQAMTTEFSPWARSPPSTTASRSR